MLTSYTAKGFSQCHFVIPVDACHSKYIKGQLGEQYIGNQTRYDQNMWYFIIF